MADKQRTSKKSSGTSGDKNRKEKMLVPAKEKKGRSKTAADRAVQGIAREESGLSLRTVGTVLSLLVFILLVVVLLAADGVVPRAVLSVVTGLVGRAGFYAAIPVFLYLFCLLAFSGKRPVRMRAVCLLCFWLLCGCMSHIVMNPQDLPKGLPLVGALWSGGIAGTTGGVLCGSVGMLLRWLLGSVMSYVVLIPLALLLLLAAFQVTIPRIIRAVRNRPRLEETEIPERPEPQDPSALVVNHIAQKRIDRARSRQQKQEAKETGREEEKTSNRSADPMSRAGADLFTPSDGENSARGPEPEKDRAEEQGGSRQAGENAPSGETAPTPEPDPAVKKVSAKDAAASAQEVAREIARGTGGDQVEYCYPPLNLLKKPPRDTTDGTEEMRENSRRLNETLASFKIDAHIVNVTRGPSVTRYEVELEKGVRLNKLTTTADDIALSLGSPGVRISAVPGKSSVVGIEVPNKSVTTVSLREVVDSQEFRRATSKSSFAVGKDIGGNAIVGNIAKLPHMLIAGTTGSGKSVCMNSIILSLLYKAGPEDVKLIMVDPKMVELGVYNGIPHLLIPVVTDPKKAAGSLQWAVTEMMRRYRAMSDAGVRDLESYNGIVDSQETEGEHLPEIVVIIDELADLMLVAAKEVEESICRIAQMGRAAGIHLLIATQRPSADVITGLMKANIPSRIAFSVASAMESRIILDTQGAEKLVGKGDMLYAPIGCGKPMRVQGCFVSDGEVEAVAGYVKEHYTTSYDQQVMAEIDKKAEQTGSKAATGDVPSADEMGHDEMLPAAVEVLLETGGQASVSLLQRRLKLGYARAARIVDEMEEMGIVGPFQGSKPRAMLITREQWQAMQEGAGQQMDFGSLPQAEPSADEDLPF